MPLRVTTCNGHCDTAIQSALDTSRRSVHLLSKSASTPGPPALPSAVDRTHCFASLQGQPHPGCRNPLSRRSSRQASFPLQLWASSSHCLRPADVKRPQKDGRQGLKTVFSKTSLPQHLPSVHCFHIYPKLPLKEDIFPPWWRRIQTSTIYLTSS